MTRLTRPAVVIPFHYGGRYVEQTLESLRAQTHRGWTAVIVIDGATQREEERLGELVRDERFTLARTSGSQGPAAARNAGARLVESMSDSLLFLDCDDVLVPTAIERLLMALNRRPEAPAAHGLAAYMGGHRSESKPSELTSWARQRLRVGSRGRLIPVPLHEPTTFGSLVVCNWISSPGQALVRRRAFTVAGGFREDVPRAFEDWDLWLRLSADGEIAYVDDVVLRWRQHEGSLSDDVAAMRDKERAYRRALSTYPGLSREQAAQAIAGHAGELWRRSKDKYGYAADALLDGRPATAARDALRAGRLTWEALRVAGQPYGAAARRLLTA